MPQFRQPHNLFPRARHIFDQDQPGMVVRAGIEMRTCMATPEEVLARPGLISEQDWRLQPAGCARCRDHRIPVVSLVGFRSSTPADQAIA